MYKVMKSFICRGCSNPVISTDHTSVDIGASANLEVVDKFCYLCDMLKGKERKEVYLYSAFIVATTLKALRRGSHSFTCK